jgi:coproporphyrinogen III oxidase-like Fe-S oxidoreductase
VNRTIHVNPPQTSGDHAATLDTQFGVYVHFPYCAKKCPYCDFASFTTQPADIPHEAYRRAVVAELELRLAARAAWPRVTSVFFGGGTPSLWDPRELGAVIAALRARLDFSPDVEITAECNPSSLDRAKATALLEVGVNRLSRSTPSASPSWGASTTSRVGSPPFAPRARRACSVCRAT